MAQIQKGTTYSTGDQVTATNLNALADAAILLPGAITDQTAKTVPLAADTVLIHSAADTALRKSTLTQLFANATGIPISTGVSGLGTGIATALAVNSGSTGAPALLGSAGAFTTLSASGQLSMSSDTALFQIKKADFTQVANFGMVKNILGSGTDTNFALSTIGTFNIYPSNTTINVAAFSSTGLAVTGALSSTTGATFATSSGNLLVGTSSGSYSTISKSSAGNFVLELQNTSATSPSVLNLKYTATSGGAGDFIQCNDNVGLKFIVNASGNVGIGTSSPADRLTVVGASGGIGYALVGRSSDGYARFQAYDRSGTVTTGSLAFFEDGSISFNRGNTGTLVERARIDSSGVLCVGATGFGYAVRAGFRGDSTSVSTVEIQNESATGTMLTFRTNGESQVGSISFTASGVTYNTSSDYRRKSNVKDLTGSGTFIDALKPRAFDWDTGDKGVGFIAHEFAEVSPTSVCGEKDAVDSDGKPIYQAMQASSAEVIANLVAELQSLRQRLAALEKSN